MVFSSLIFLFLFLPVTLTLYLVLDKSLRRIFLFLASLFFYTWGEGHYVLLLIVFIIGNYIFGRFLERFHNQPRRAKIILSLAIASNLSLLLYWKYSQFFGEVFNTLLSFVHLDPLAIPSATHLPLGISFFTFQAISYVIDVYRRDISATANIMDFAFYKSFFPQLIAGPVVRYKQLASQLTSNSPIDSDDFLYGVKLFIIGLGKKVLIADTVALVADQIFAIPVTELTPAIAWLGALCYALQIYFDFSGYSDMAIGLARLFGYKFPENFNYPYIATSVQDFWRRWHITLSSWFRDYLYIPLGGNRKGEFRTYAHIVFVFLLTGLWHGAAWTFVLWGAWHALFMVIERTRLGTLISLAPVPFRHAYTLVAILFGWVIFRSPSPESALVFMKSMVGVSSALSPHHLNDFITPHLILVLVIGGIASIPWKWKMFRSDSRTTRAVQRTLTALGTFSFFVLIYFYSVAALASGTYSPFIYFRF